VCACPVAYYYSVRVSVRPAHIILCAAVICLQRQRSYLLENKYPKVKAPSAAAPSPTPRVNYDFSSRSSFDPTPAYTLEAANLLHSDFPFLSVAGARNLIKMPTANGHYALVHDYVVNMLLQCSPLLESPTAMASASMAQIEEQWTRFANAVVFKRADSTQISHLESIRDTGPPAASSSSLQQASIWTNWLGTIKSSLTRQWKGAPPPTPDIVDSILQAERRYVETKTNELVRIKKLAYQRRVNKESAIKDGTSVDCQCCFDGSAVEDMIGCLVEGHLFCVSCVQSYAQNVMFDSGNLGRTRKPSLEMLCFHGDGCTSSFHRKDLEDRLPKALLQKYDEVQFALTLDRAGLANDVASCPKCNFQAMVHPSVRVFVCPVDSCRYESCRECGDEAHVPLRCDEVEKKHETASRLQVEEAISLTKIRVCPKCKKGFVKRFVCLFKDFYSGDSSAHSLHVIWFAARAVTTLLAAVGRRFATSVDA
jgi:E3 ubiquitin-protein ligase RNF216